MADRLSPKQIARLEKILSHFTPAERRLLAESRDQIAALPHKEQMALAREIAKLAHQRTQT